MFNSLDKAWSGNLGSDRIRLHQNELKKINFSCVDNRKL